jgi:glycosyltransferase involved in cell wall biosynthesis
MQILVAINNFWVGGRETFLSCYLTSLAGFGVRADLIASSIFEGTPDLAVFASARACTGDSTAARCRVWLREAELMIGQRRPELIWAHHYDLLPAWLVSRRFGIPLLTTFHGPLLGDDRPNDPMQALGMTFALCRGEYVSGVSDEVLGGIRTLNSDRVPQALIPNAIDLDPAGSRSKRTELPCAFTMVTRREKLAHLRNAALFLHAYRRMTGRGRLVIAAGLSPKDSVTPSGGLRGLARRIGDTVRGLGGKWCWDQGPAFIPTVFNIVWHGYTGTPQELIRRGDAVLGMGRVVLEGLAEGKPVALIGYDRICGAVTPGTFDDYRRSNFSGRGIPPAVPADAVTGFLEFCRAGGRQLPEHLDLVSSAPCAARLHDLFLRTAALRVVSRDRCADTLCRMVLDPECRDEVLFSTACGLLSPEELASFFLLSKG